MKLQVLGLLVCSMLFAPGLGGNAAAVNLSKNTGSSCCAEVVIKGANVFVVWEDNVLGELHLDAFFRRSADGGVTFLKKRNLSKNPGDSVNPHIAVRGPNLYVVWADFEGSGVGDIFLRRSTDGGATFQPVQNLTPGNLNPSVAPRVAADGDNVYVVWSESTGTNSEIFFARSTNSGVSFETAQNLSNNTGLSLFPQLLVAKSDGTIYVAWEDDSPGNGDILFRRSTDGGMTFDPEQNLSSNAGLSERFQMAAAGGNVYVVWQDFTDFATTSGDILFRRSDDSGATFDATVNLSSTAEGFSQLPQVAAQGSNVFVVWEDDDPGNLEILFRSSDNGGVTFAATVNLSQTVGTSGNASLAAKAGRVVVAWEDDSLAGKTDIFVKTSNDSGATFGGIQNLTATSDLLAERPRAAVGLFGAVVVWEQKTGPGNRDIFSRRVP